MNGAENGPSKDAEISYKPDTTTTTELGLGTQLAAIGRSLNGATFDVLRDPTPVKDLQIAPSTD
jgi:hypothetical protein